MRASSQLLPSQVMGNYPYKSFLGIMAMRQLPAQRSGHHDLGFDWDGAAGNLNLGCDWDGAGRESSSERQCLTNGGRQIAVQPVCHLFTPAHARRVLSEKLLLCQH